MKTKILFLSCLLGGLLISTMPRPVYAHVDSGIQTNRSAMIARQVIEQAKLFLVEIKETQRLIQQGTSGNPSSSKEKNKPEEYQPIVIGEFAQYAKKGLKGQKEYRDHLTKALTLTTKTPEEYDEVLRRGNILLHTAAADVYGKSVRLRAVTEDDQTRRNDNAAKNAPGLLEKGASYAAYIRAIAIEQNGINMLEAMEAYLSGSIQLPNIVAETNPANPFGVGASPFEEEKKGSSK